MIEKTLAGPVGILLKFSVLQEHGVDKVFLLENDNVDASQKNVIFLASGEKAPAPIAIAGMLNRAHFSFEQICFVYAPLASTRIEISCPS